MTQNINSITFDMVDTAITRVEHANHINLEALKNTLSVNPDQAVEMFNSLVCIDSIDDKFKQIMNSYPQLLDNAQHLLETSILLS
ncbi:hypothetical protein VME0621_01305 [Vibrio mediterranei]|jgi:hypothetical protein|uniref:Uncharacterized protein n=1 Tax=Vibrio mediterranei TaxID=689 RepID=A0A2C9PEY5_9VIBR|nr:MULTISPECIES: hypothetical protein [Vibrio]ASI91243.1 hypothetical protein BSZ05_16300 [Vibrio mediterranei]AYV20132.1 hypothetical protein ECB94_01925 [Vibrio mediterranei]EDL53435.1 hypothetical protein VSAK1_06565 [Vibrio mediterranei AK1]KFA95007.1 hypothetical protein HW45_27890 [Vibrio sp. ER1A]MCF4175754.1 hypothetical protein [Vibrio sp. McD22-P3]